MNKVTYIFKTLHDRFGIEIDFAYQTFEWNNEASDQAHVHVVVIGFDTIRESGRLRMLYTPEGLRFVENINFYLVAAPNDFAESTNKAVSESAPAIMGGNRPADGGNLIIEAEDYERLYQRRERLYTKLCFDGTNSLQLLRKFVYTQKTLQTRAVLIPVPTIISEAL